MRPCKPYETGALIEDINRNVLSHNDAIQVELIIHAIKLRYGYCFANYSKESFFRRLLNFQNRHNLRYLTDVIPLLIHDSEFFIDLIDTCLIGVTEFFRDESFFISFRKNVVPYLKSFPYLKIWHAGCSTGQETYSMAVLLDCEQLLSSSVIYGTDINNRSISIAKKGIYSLENFKKAEIKFKTIYPDNPFGTYYIQNQNHGKFRDSMVQNITYSKHNLTQDQSFGQMNVICCRNVIIYFNHALQERVFQLFYDSLRNGGFLCLGKSETLLNSSLKDKFKVIDKEQKIYQKIGDISHAK